MDDRDVKGPYAMRHPYHLDERDLDECVRRQVITPEQRDGVLAYVRSRIAEASTRGRQDFGWVSWVYLAAAGFAVAMPAMLVMGSLRSIDPATLAVTSAMAMGVLAFVGLALRRTASGHAAGALLLAASLTMVWGVAAGAFALVAHRSFGLDPPYDESYVTWFESARRALNAYAVGDFAVITACVVGARRFRLPAAAFPASAAGLHLVATLADRFAGEPFWSRGDFTVIPHHTLVVAAMAASVVLVLATRLFERAARTASGDAPFWVHFVALLVFGFAACVQIADAPSSMLAFVALALAWAALGVVWRRPVYFAASAVGVLLFPLIALDAHRHGSQLSEAVMVLVGSSTVVMLGTAIVRRVSERRTTVTSDGVDWSTQSIWG